MTLKRKKEEEHYDSLDIKERFPDWKTEAISMWMSDLHSPWLLQTIDLWEL